FQEEGLSQQQLDLIGRARLVDVPQFLFRRSAVSHLQIQLPQQESGVEIVRVALDRIAELDDGGGGIALLQPLQSVLVERNRLRLLRRVGKAAARVRKEYDRNDGDAQNGREARQNRCDGARDPCAGRGIGAQVAISGFQAGGHLMSKSFIKL